MKKKLIITGIFVLFMGLIAGIFCYYIQWKQARREQIEEAMLLIEYNRQNRAFGMGERVQGQGYQGYEEVNETELYVRLAAYNSWNVQKDNGKPEISIEDIKEYLSSEYNEDGSLRVTSRPENIQEYMNWYSEGGDGEIKKFRVELEILVSNYKVEHPENVEMVIGNMNVKQLQEIINKYNDPSYEINTEIMGEQE